MIEDNKHRIFILEGRDRLGKTTCVAKLIELYESKGYDVVPVSKARPTIKNKIVPVDEFGLLYKNNPDYAEYSGCSFEVWATLSRRILELSTKPTCIIFDRMQLSIWVYGMLRRPHRFLEIHKSIGFYITYMNTFEKYLNSIASTKMITFVTDHLTEFDDNANANHSVTAKEINIANEMFKTSQSHSILDKYEINCKWNEEAQLYDTIEQFNDMLTNSLKYRRTTNT